MQLSISKQFQSFIQSLGMPFEQFLAESDIPNYMWKEELTVSNEQYYRLLHTMDKYVTDEQTLVFSDVKNINMFLPPIFAALSAENGIGALERLSKYKQLIGPINFEITQHDQTVAIHFSFLYPEQALPKFAVLNEQLLVLSLLRTGTGKQIDPLSISSPYNYSDIIAKTFNTHIEQTDSNLIVFNKKDLLYPFATHNNVMWDFLESEFNHRLAELANNQKFTSTIQSILFKLIPSGKFTLEDIAKNIGLSTRTIQRNLSAENTTYKQQLQKVQKLMAINYIKNYHIEIDEVAYLIGYSETSSFLRAFKKWTGQTITQFKENY
ncbi:helix-turn-helix transcriptional regulator [Mammaliicoccus sciuri]|uniref:helix-turn-helix transcriptional regulator n=1 Tax=Mammaliicoccus sciuri TaxID=1296 RepID=UPI001FB1C8AF|nr:AraC family transcriptional regulator [Mammaliicoccus sciuri]MCJ1782622.1 AraC family transcriptional regulator [Mammaliicoccus sciuri]